MFNKKKILALLLCLVLVMVMTCIVGFCNATNNTEKQFTYPERDIKITCGYPAGGGSDLLTRTIMRYIDLPVNLVPICIVGSGGYTAALELYHSDSDGYTICNHNPSAMLGWDLAGTSDIPLWQELTTICSVVQDYYLIATSKETGWTSFDDVVAYAKEHPGEIQWGNNGSGSTMNAIALAVAESLGIDATMVPYSGGADVRNALLGGHIQLATSSNGDIFSYIQSGDVVNLAVFRKERSPLCPDVPTTIELGVPVMCGLPKAIYGPPGMDKEVVDYLSKKFKEVTENPEYIAACKSMGWVSEFQSGKDTVADVKSWKDGLAPIFKRFSE